MAKGKSLIDIERGRISELQKQNLSQYAIISETGRIKIVIANFLKDPYAYRRKQLIVRL